MESVGQILGVSTRTACLLGGRYGGLTLTLLRCGDAGWPTHLCLGLPAASEHYVHEGLTPGGYVWAGACAGHDGG